MTPSAQADQRIEAELVAAGLNASRITAEQIQSLIEKLTWKYEKHESPNVVFAHAFLGDFYIATGFSKTVSTDNFRAELAHKYAQEQAEAKARDKLWELEGYHLYKRLRMRADAPCNCHKMA